MLGPLPEDFEYVLALHEAVAVGMADGFAQASGNVTHVNLHTAPGLGNGVGAIFNARANRAPLLITAGQQARSLMTMQATLTNRDAVEVPRPFVKWAYEPPRPADVPAALAQAIHHASPSSRGPRLRLDPDGRLGGGDRAAGVRQPDRPFTACPHPSRGRRDRRSRRPPEGCPPAGAGGGPGDRRRRRVGCRCRARGGARARRLGLAADGGESDRVSRGSPRLPGGPAPRRRPPRGSPGGPRSRARRRLRGVSLLPQHPRRVPPRGSGAGGDHERPRRGCAGADGRRDRRRCRSHPAGTRRRPRRCGRSAAAPPAPPRGGPPRTATRSLPRRSTQRSPSCSRRAG